MYDRRRLLGVTETHRCPLQSRLAALPALSALASADDLLAASARTLEHGSRAGGAFDRSALDNGAGAHGIIPVLTAPAICLPTASGPTPGASLTTPPATLGTAIGT